MVFLAPPPPTQAPGPLRRYQLSLDTRGDLVLDSVSDVALVRRQWTDRQVLMRGVQALDLAYFGLQAPNKTPAWTDTWYEESVLPSLVRIRLAFPAGDRRRWPDLIVHPQADVDADCQLVAGAGCKGR
jgi:general secretion pathway protein J